MKNLDFSKIKYVLLDVEGTTSDISFVREVLFPYSAKELRNFISSNKNNASVKEILNGLQANNAEEAIQMLLTWIKEDNKHPALKALQGMIWKQGFQNKEFKSPVYPDVIPALQHWKELGLGLGIYSSGSVQAQKLFFTYTEQGDLTPYFDHHFDLEMGGKKEAPSYAKISHRLNLPPNSILFLSDIPEEIMAAQTAGLQTIHVLRPGTEDADLQSIHSFQEIT